MTILDLCGGTGAWSRPYAEAGYDVRVITLPEQDVRTYVPPSRVHGILAAPPCTMFSLARQRSKTPRDFFAGMATVRACLEIIWNCRAGHSLSWWALENPVGYMRQFLGRPALTFQPCDYGDLSTKRTDLWGYFSNPRKRPRRIIKNRGKQFGGTRGWSMARTGEAGLTRQQVRSVTPPMFARAFFEANP